MITYRCIIILVIIKILVANPVNWEINASVLCPKQCVCQYGHFMDLSIARWINSMQMGLNKHQKDETENLVNNNEALYDGDESYLNNPFMKLATCIFQPETESSEFFSSLPLDVQALVILYTGEANNSTGIIFHYEKYNLFQKLNLVTTKEIKTLNQLTTLEIRGTKDRSFQLIIDEPLTFLENVNFESIQLIGSESFKRPTNPVHPSESFDYVPNSEKIDYNVSVEYNEENEILPYEVYMMERKKSRMATFYGWEHLEVLRIHNCKLDELYWEMFDGLSELQHLSLERNEIKIIPAFALYGAMHIKTLSLAHNYILDLNYRSLAGLLELEVLDLSYNNLSKLSELTFPPFPKLEYVDFRHNPIRYIFPATFGVMNYTKTIFLGSKDVELELTPNNPFQSLELLQFLSISNVSISVLNQNVFSGLRNIQYLNLRGFVRKIDFDAFVDMSKVREIDLSRCNIQKISMDAFIGCKSLEVINLSFNNLSYIPPGIFDEQKLLTEIYLNNNRLRFLPSSFFNNPYLKLVRLTENPWKCSCDMTFWKPKITNQQRGKKQERCITEFHSGKIISCRTLNNYKFDNRLAPRCANVKNRSVYYALRKDLQCDFKKEMERHMRNQRHDMKKGSKYKHLEDKKDKKKVKLEKQRQSNIDITEINQIHRQIKNPKGNLNSIEFLSKTNLHYTSVTNSSSNHSVSNNIDENNSFNYV